MWGLLNTGFTELHAYGQPGVNAWAMFAARGRATFFFFSLGVEGWNFSEFMGAAF